MPVVTADLQTTSVRMLMEGRTWLDADVVTPPDAKGVVLFAHGSGSSRHSPRNRHVALEMNDHHLATVLADLLSEDEERLDQRTRALRFDIPLLTRRLVRMIDWLSSSAVVGPLPIGLFGASTGAAAALDVAAARPAAVEAVVSRGGRPDLASNIRGVRAPTLLIAGGDDPDVLRLNTDALQRLTCLKRLEVVPGATHLFEEPHALDVVAAAAGAWFQQYLR